MKRFTLAVMFFVLPTVLLPACHSTSESTATLVQAAALSPDAVTADPARYSVLFENDVASLIRVKFAPGSKSVMHSHPASCVIFYKDSKFKMTAPAGEVQTSENHAGDVSCVDAYSHLPENIGTGEAELIVLHLKGRKTFDHVQTGRSVPVPSQPNAPDPVAVDPSHYSVQFENDAIRIIRIKVPGGVKSPMHAHHAYCIVEIRDMVTPTADGNTTEVKAGDASCGDAMAHASQNNAKTLNEAITIEFKNRDKFKS